MQKKAIHVLPFDLFHIVKKEWGIGEPELVTFPDIPGVKFHAQKIRINFSGTVTVGKKQNPFAAHAKESVFIDHSVYDFSKYVKKNNGFPVLMYGYKQNTSQCSIHYADVKYHQIPSPILATVNAGKVTPQEMLRPFCEYREVVDTSFWGFTKDDTQRFKAILDFFHESYTTLIGSGNYERNPLDLRDVHDFFNETTPLKEEGNFFVKKLLH